MGLLTVIGTLILVAFISSLGNDIPETKKITREELKAALAVKD